VIYDPNDPHASLYDVDDGTSYLFILFFSINIDLNPLIDSTVITLADWYHYLSTEAPAVPSVLYQ
jgi:iron transport multicopper oxidase